MLPAAARREADRARAAAHARYAARRDLERARALLRTRAVALHSLGALTACADCGARVFAAEAARGVCCKNGAHVLGVDLNPSIDTNLEQEQHGRPVWAYYLRLPLVLTITITMLFS